ncbi:MAG: CoA transferase [Desulfobacteraceae bacterium]|nr:CoA transferase [Desulfobacteraceae bacterium]
MTKKALEGIKIIEVGHFISGPYCTKLMADLGAEVIKIEDPVAGVDEARIHGPFPGDVPHPEKSGLFLWLNANKKGITLNLGSTQGREVLERLLKEADILVRNAPPGKSCAWDMTPDFETLKQINPKLIVTSISPFGQSGPYRDYKAYELNVSAASGVSVASGDPEREPLVLPFFQTYYQAGAAAAGATLTAWLALENTDCGQHIEISEVEVSANNLVGQHLTTFIYRGLTGIRRGHHGGYFNYPCTCLPCKDGFVCLVAPQVAQWKRFIELMGTPEWSKQPRYRDRREMAETYPDEVDALLIAWLEKYTKEEIFAMCMERKVPFSPVRTIEEVAIDPQLRARGFWTELDHSEVGRLRYPGSGYELSKTPAALEHPAPILGEHNREILVDRLGYTKEQVENISKERSHVES